MNAGLTSITVGRLAAEPGRLPVAGPSTIRIESGRIVAIDTAPPDSGTAGLIALPAPTNAHDHGRGVRPITVGALDDVLETWISGLGREPHVDTYTRAAAAFARMAEGGVCAANHCHYSTRPDRLVEDAEAVSRAAHDVGIRIAFAVPISDRNPVVYGDLAALRDVLPAEDAAALMAKAGPFPSAAEALAAVDAIAAFEHLGFSVQYCPIGPQWVQDSTLSAIAEASADTGRRVHMHLLETRPQREWADHAYPGGLLRHLDGIGLLSPRLTVAHGVWLTADECALLAERGVTVSANTSSNLRLRSGLANLRRWTEAGLRFGVGLDGMAFDDDEDMLREMRLLFCLQRGFGGDDILTPGDLVRAACIDGRRTVVADDGGRLVPGAPADLMVVDLAAMGGDMIDPAVDPLNLMLTRMSKAHLRKLVVAGRTIVADGRCVTVDRLALQARIVAEARADWAANPPDDARFGRLQTAIRLFYACGCHVGRPMIAS